MKGDEIIILREQRHRYILDLLNKSGSIKISELASNLNTAQMTVRRDLKYLESNGLLYRTYGGALRREVVIVHELSLKEKRDINTQKKREIAQIAASLIDDDDIIYVGPGTTNEYLCEYIVAKRTKIISNCLTIFEQFKDDSRFEVILVGGKFRHKTNAFIGTFTNQMLSNMRVKKAFIGANAICGNDIFTANEDEASSQKIIMDKAIKRFILCDSSKIEMEDFFRLYKLNEATALITDATLSDGLAKKYSEYCEVIRAKK